MRTGEGRYIPCLRWKQGEYQALLRLSAGARAGIVPLIEVPEIGFDFETKTEAKSVDEHLQPFAGRVREKWGREECFVDVRNVGATERLATGQDVVTFVFDGLRARGVTAVPVVGPAEGNETQDAVRDIVAKDGRGLALRVGIEAAADVRIGASMDELLVGCGLTAEQCDLIVDVGAPNFDPIDGFAEILEGVLMGLPYLERWRTVGLIGTSFPASMALLRPGASIIPRNEWRLYKLVAGRLARLRARVPCFGDYTINHPDVPSVDMRLVKPYASVRYTIDDAWLVVRGQNVRDYGFRQYRELCGVVVGAGDYSGPGFSDGDGYINRCAQGLASTGNLTTWRWVGTNHHLEMVARDVAALRVA